MFSCANYGTSMLEIASHDVVISSVFALVATVFFMFVNANVERFFSRYFETTYWSIVVLYIMVHRITVYAHQWHDKKSPANARSIWKHCETRHCNVVSYPLSGEKAKIWHVQQNKSRWYVFFQVFCSNWASFTLLDVMITFWDGRSGLYMND